MSDGGYGCRHQSRAFQESSKAISTLIQQMDIWGTSFLLHVNKRAFSIPDQKGSITGEIKRLR